MQKKSKFCIFFNKKKEIALKQLIFNSVGRKICFTSMKKKLMQFEKMLT